MRYAHPKTTLHHHCQRQPDNIATLLSTGIEGAFMADYQAMWKDLGMDLGDARPAVRRAADGVQRHASRRRTALNMAFYDFVVSRDPRRARGAHRAAKAGRQGVRHVLRVRAHDEVVVACGSAVTGLCGSQFWVPEG